MKQPTERTLTRLRKDGYLAQVVERYNHWSKRRSDLFGIIDIVAIHETAGIKGIQATSFTNQAAHISKCLKEPRLVTWLKAGGRFECWAWKKVRKQGNRKLWQPSVKAFDVEQDGSVSVRTVEA